MSEDEPDICPTMVSDLIVQLQEHLAIHGDMPIACAGHDHVAACITVNLQEYYYDGGCLYPARSRSDYGKHWVRSRTHRLGWRYFARIRTDEPEGNLVDLEDTGETIDGEPVVFQDDCPHCKGTGLLPILDTSPESRHGVHKNDYE